MDTQITPDDRATARSRGAWRAGPYRLLDYRQQPIGRPEADRIISAAGEPTGPYLENLIVFVFLCSWGVVPSSL
jgi:hypothetical protein